MVDDKPLGLVLGFDHRRFSEQFLQPVLAS